MIYFAWLLSALTPVEFNTKGVDRTLEYQRQIEYLSNHEGSWDEFTDVKFLFVNGFMSDQFLMMEDWPIAKKFSHPFDEQKKWLSELGIDYEVIPTKSEHIPEVNVPIILKFISESPKPVVFISHSRGGLDVLQALLESNSELLKKVRGWIALQSPFQGTPMADEVLRNTKIKNVVAKALRKMGGSIDSVIAMSTENRRKFLAENSEKISRLFGRVPTISFSSWKPNHGRGIDTTYEIQRNYLESLGYQTDGLVPWQSEIMPGGGFVFQSGVDHPSTVNKSFFVAFDRVLMTKALLKVISLKLRH